MENKLQLGDEPITLDIARFFAGVLDVDRVGAVEGQLPVCTLVDPRKAEDKRLAFTVAVENAPKPTRIQLRNGFVLISEVLEKGAEPVNLHN